MSVTQEQEENIAGLSAEASKMVSRLLSRAIESVDRMAAERNAMAAEMRRLSVLRANTLATLHALPGMIRLEKLAVDTDGERARLDWAAELVERLVYGTASAESAAKALEAAHVAGESGEIAPALVAIESEGGEV